MTNSHTDIELIMALAEETLPAAQAAAAEAALDDASRAELAVQRQALAALADLTAAEMTDAERTRVGDMIRSELNLGLTVDASPDARPEKGQLPWYLRALPVLGAAAALVLIVGIGLNSISFPPIGGSDSASEAASDVTVAAATTGATAVGKVAEEGAVFDRAVAEDFDDAAALAAESPMAAPATTTAAATEEAAAATVSPASDGTLGSLMVPHDLGEVSLSDLDDIAARVEKAGDELFQDLSYSAARFIEAGLVCWELILDEGEGAQMTYVGTATIDGTNTEVYRTEEPSGLITIHLFAGPTCDPVALIIP